jgi:hypothetical protein
MTARGHFDPFPTPKLSAGCEFRKETVGGLSRNEKDALDPTS